MIYQKIDKQSGPKVSGCPRTHFLLSLGLRKLGENLTPGAVRMCKSRGRPGGGWSGLELTDT